MTEKTNIILFLTDDHAQWAVGAYKNPAINTPNLDFLANTGALMENAYSPTPVCSPGRACLLTGRMASQHGLHDYLSSGVDDAIDSHEWLRGETLLPDLLKKSGYKTYLSGKWHLGHEAKPKTDFDQTFTMGDEYPFTHDGKRTFFEDGNPIEEVGYKTQIFTEKAIDYLRQHDHDHPFFLQVGYIGTHSPWEGHPERLVNQYRNQALTDKTNKSSYPFGIQNLESTLHYRNNPHESLAQYYGAVSHIDEKVGQILDAVDSLELKENTLIIYTSDHGINCGHHGIWGKGNGTLPLNMVEESVRVPLILNHPGNILPNQHCLEFVDHTDLFQTILAYAGVELDQSFIQERNYPGRSFASQLTHELPLREWRQHQICEYGDVRMIRNQQWKLIRRYPDGPNELIDLIKDPNEEVNLFHQVNNQEIIQQLTTILDRHFAQYADEINNGLNVKKLPLQNHTEAWRDPRNLH